MTSKKIEQMIPLLKGKQAKDWITKNLAQAKSEDRNLEITQAVTDIISLVRAKGDEGLSELASRFGDRAPRTLTLSASELDLVSSRLPMKTKSVLNEAAKRIRAFAEQVASTARKVELDCGEYTAGYETEPVERVACYIPAGRYPLPSTALMTAITARAAGVKEICVCSPVLSDEIVYAGSLAGVTEFHEVGGAQAVAAAAYGTATIKAVDMIVGPGNAYVTEAKRQVYGVVGIDMLAGPSEIAIVADSGSNPKWLALDLLSQAEHDPDARAYLLTDSEAIADGVIEQLSELLKSMDLPPFIHESLASSVILVLESIEACVEVTNQIAPEHLQLQTADPEKQKLSLTNYGALFMGYHTTVPFGDYMAGPNHTLPTNKAARFTGGLNPFTFLRCQTWVHVKPGAVELPRLTAEFADLEGLRAHAAAARARTE